MVMEGLKVCAVIKSIYCYEWHIKNLGFTDTAPTQFRLLDWHGHKVDTRMTEKGRMKHAVKSFIAYLAATAPPTPTTPCSAAERADGNAHVLAGGSTGPCPAIGRLPIRFRPGGQPTSMVTDRTMTSRIGPPPYGEVSSNR